MPPPRTPRAFTLIELLVVITIIVVLLALLTPALDKAVYQAQLAVCGTNHKAIGNAVSIYATDHRRSYPQRHGVKDTGTTRPSLISRSGTGGVFDDRPTLRPYMGINAIMGCPLNAKVDYESRDGGAWVYSSQQLWFGWRYDDLQGMRKLGDRFEWVTPGTPARTYRFNALASDWVTMAIDSALVGAQGSHPDHEGRLRPDVQHNNGTPAQNNVYSMFRIDNTPIRGPIDRNVLFDDGSVARYLGVRWNEHEFDDGQMVWVPEQNNTPGSFGYISHLPAAQ